MRALRRYADRRNQQSLSALFRRRRLRHFRRLLDELPRPVKVLDLGGEEVFWETFGDTSGLDITILNIEPVPVSLGNVRALVGDAHDLSAFPDKAFDLVASNSLIEHVDDPFQVAQEIRRVGKRYYVQTPNRWFPMEPHFLVPFFQFLPLGVRARLLTRFDLGWLRREAEYASALRTVASVRLLSAKELRALFPEANLWRERVLGLTKSLVAYHGWQGDSDSRR